MRKLLLPLGLMLTTNINSQAQTTASMTSTPAAVPSRMSTLTLRLRPGQDLRQQLIAMVQARGIRAGAVVTCVGSLTQVTLRLANQEGPSAYRGHFEIVSLVGTLAESGSHLHLSVSDSTGRTIGGHLLDGNLVYTTAEIVLGVLEDVEFRREVDPAFGYKELTVYPITPARSEPVGRGRTRIKK